MVSVFSRPAVLPGLLLVPGLLLSGLAVGAAAGDTPASPAVAPAAVKLPGTAAASDAVPALAGAAASSPAAQSTSAAAGAVAENTPPCATTAHVCVDLSARKAWITDGAGRIEYGPVRVLGGRAGEPTPQGTFHVTSKAVEYHSREFDAPMPYSVFFYPGVAFHQGSLSVRSAGCLHLSRASAKEFFGRLSPGDSVQVTS